MNYLLLCGIMNYLNNGLFMGKAEWNQEAANLLKSELARAGVRYDELVTRLAGLGIDETYKGIANKINRGSFTLTFFMQCMKALDKNFIRFDSEQ